MALLSPGHFADDQADEGVLWLSWFLFCYWATRLPLQMTRCSLDHVRTLLASLPPLGWCSNASFPEKASNVSSSEGSLLVLSLVLNGTLSSVATTESHLTMETAMWKLAHSSQLITSAGWTVSTVDHGSSQVRNNQLQEAFIPHPLCQHEL